ncbi:MAG TPA: sugar porter family MFS transporter, partial [Verrucomicrobiae bacterium]|nr:sugar porter family MFS transporter [Verrucomicrobiae bacterium]
MKHGSLYTVSIALIVAVGGFLLGFDATVISGAVPFIKKFFQLSGTGGDLKLGWAVSCLGWGALGGNALAGLLSDAFGRKKVLMLTAVLFTVSALLSATTNDFAIFVISRILGGVAVGGAILIAPVYIAEIAPSALRGSLVSFNQLMIVIGISASFFSNYYLLRLGENCWRWMLGVEAIPAALYFVLLFFVPESPRWLYGKGREEQAREIFTKVAGAAQAEEELSRIRQNAAEHVAGVGAGALFSRRMRFVMFIALTIAFFQQITGINAIFYYLPSIFSKAGGGMDSAFKQAVIVGLVNLGMTFVAIKWIDRLGRKPLLVIGTAGISLSLLTCAAAFHNSNYQLTEKSFASLRAGKVPEDIISDLQKGGPQVFATENEFLSAMDSKLGADRLAPFHDALTSASLNIRASLVLFAIIGFVASFAISLGPVMWVLLSEIFPNAYRGTAISIVGFWNSVVSATVTMIFPWELSHLGTAGTFFGYGLLGLAALVFVLMAIPETKGKSLEELEHFFVRGVTAIDTTSPAPQPKYVSTKLPLVLFIALAFAGSLVASENAKPGGPAKVEVRQTDGHWQLLVNQRPFYIKGVGLEFGDQEKLAAAGGNSFRTWRTEKGRQVLDLAQKNGLYVTMGLDLSKERHGFDYSDPAAVAKQLEGIKAQVLQLKDHPALLMWDIGNELNLNSHNPKVWDAVNEISKMIHQIDPNHPTTTSLAGVSKNVVEQIKSRAPDLDLLCFQSYADIVNLQREIRESGWSGPYAVTEWGATGHWECGKTAWGAPIEDDSSVKADFFRRRYELAIAADTKNCLGSYAFLWGQKQERTPTWYGMFLPAGETTETVDVLQHLWTGQWPELRSPQVKGFWL